MSGRWHVHRRRGCEGWVVVQRGREGASLRFLPSHAEAMTYIEQALMNREDTREGPPL
ncbi:MAG TPA: hypothetical protein VK053_11385 [Jiangellaceae bacterium]|nr:hypothetical protein [Jiangellaceae bacterium]